MQLDPRVAALIKTGCGAEAQATPKPLELRDFTAPRRLAFFNAPPLGGTAAPNVALALADQEPSPGPSPTGGGAAPTPGASAAASAAPSAPAAAATTTPVPGPPPVPPGPPGPSVIIPPTPRPSGSPQPTAPPPPTPSPVPSALVGPQQLVRPTGSPPPIPAAGSSATPIPRATASAAGPTPIPTLGPSEVAVGADRFDGYLERGHVSDLDGNVHIFYLEGQVVGDRAHYDGKRTILVSGHTYLINRNQDAILYADSISFDLDDKRATLNHGTGETTEGVQRGKLYYTADTLTSLSSGISHGERASFTTCANPHGGYHVESRSIDVTPGDKLIARKAVVFLGALAIFYLPALVIPLREQKDPRKQTTFLPVLGYSQVEGYYVKARIGFSPSATYYGYYRVDYYTKRGLGLGYSAAFGTNNGRRAATVDAYTINDHIVAARQTNVNLTETENFSSRLRSTLNYQYTGDFGAGLTLPASNNLSGTLSYTGAKSNEQLTFSRFKQGAISDTDSFGFIQTLQLSSVFQQTFNVSLSRFNSQLASSGTLHLSALTHYFSRFADANLAYDKTDYTNFSSSSGYDRVPELQILPHWNLKGYPLQPFTTQFTIGEYTEPQNGFSTPRAEFVFNQPAFVKLGKSDFTATYNIRQDFYGTGDMKAFDTQTAALTTPLGNHIVNAITYNEQHPIGPANVPFQLFDRLSSGSHNAQDVIRFFNGDIYTFSLSASTFFNRQAQPLQYQLNARPSPRSVLVIGGFYTPGPGNGFGQTNFQTFTPFGRDTYLTFSANVDWKQHNRILNKNIFLSKIIGDCYRLDASYNQDLRQFTFNVTILAFPNQTVGVGSGAPTSILPQNFAF